MNKFELMNTVLVSDLASGDKALLCELILRSDSEGKSWPSVERLCKVRGIKHEKNFKGAEVYLPGLVTKVKVGRKNHYFLNTPAIEGLSEMTVTIKHTPALEGVSPTDDINAPAQEGAYTPAAADNTPARADNTPAVEGANSTSNNTENNTRDNTSASGEAQPAPLRGLASFKSSLNNNTSLDEQTTHPPLESSTGFRSDNTPSGAGVLDWWDDDDPNAYEKAKAEGRTYEAAELDW